MSKVENYRSESAHEPEKFEDPVDDDRSGEHELDSETHQELHKRIIEWFEQCREAHADNRAQQALDEDFYDGDQWSYEDAQVLAERGQAPLVYNLVKPAVDWISGTEKRTRIDYNVLAKKDTPEHNRAALSKLKLLKHVSDVNHGPFHRSDAFKSAVKVGVGWLECGVRNDESDELIYDRWESWRNVWYDHMSVERDLSDARYMFRTRWVDLDVAITMFPDRAEALRQAAFKTSGELFDDDDAWVGNMYAGQRNSDNPDAVTIRRTFSNDPHAANSKRERVRIIECWFKVPENVKLLRGDQSCGCHGQLLDEEDERQLKAMQEGIVSVYDATVMRMRVALLTEGHLLQEMASPYRHNKFPFTPVWGFRRGRDNMAYGVIRNARDPQEDLNKRRSKALHILSTRQIIADKNAVDDWDETIEEAARPDGILKVRGDKRFEIASDRELAQQHIELMQQDREFINNTSGVTGENLGLDSNAVSGRAIVAKQQEGSTVTYELFDNLRLALQLHGEKMLSLVEQWYDEPKTFRIVGEKGNNEFVAVNEPEYDPVSNSYVVKNDITSSRHDFLVDSQDFRQTVRQAMFVQMLDMMKTLPPEISINILDLLVDLSDLPGKDTLVQRIRAINGQAGPDEEITPEQLAQQEAERQAAEAERKLQQREVASKIAERDARTNKVKMETQDLAIDAGQKAAVSAPTAPASDALLRSSGYRDNGAQ